MYVLYRDGGASNELYEDVVMIPGDNLKEAEDIAVNWLPDTQQAAFCRIDDSKLEAEIARYYGWEGRQATGYSEGGDNRPALSEDLDYEPPLHYGDGETVWRSVTLPNSEPLQDYLPFPSFDVSHPDYSDDDMDAYYERPDIRFHYPDGLVAIQAGYRPAKK